MNRKRYNIGLLINGLDDEFTNAVCKGASESVERNNAGLVIFPGNNFQAQITSERDKILNSQYKTIFDYACSESFDAVIISFSTIFRDRFCSEANDLRKRFGDIPVVTLCIEEEGYGCVRYEPSSGIRELISHIIEQHGCRRIAFVSGQMGNPDSDARLAMYRSTLAEYGIPYDPRYVVNGDFTVDSCCAISRLFDGEFARPEAICCASDRLAGDAYKVAEEHDLQIGEDIIITGYDNVIISHTLIPQMTTVNANPCNLGAKAVELACEMIQTQMPRTITLNSMPIIRESCGMHIDKSVLIKPLENVDILMNLEKRSGVGMLNSFDPTINIFIRELFSQLNDTSVERIESGKLTELFHQATAAKRGDTISAATLEDLVRMLQVMATHTDASPEKQLQVIELFAELHARACSNMVSQVYQQVLGNRSNSFLINNILSLVDSDVRVSLAEIIHQLCRLDIRSTYIYLAPEPVEITDPNSAVMFEYLELAAYHRRYDCVVPEKPVRVRVSEIFENGGFRREPRSTYILVPLFTSGKQLGLAIYEISCAFLPLVLAVSEQVSSAIESSIMLSRLNAHIESAEYRNSMLNTLALRDTLTGQLNRAGFYEAAEVKARSVENYGRGAIAAYIDMNNLKMTNDTFGHEQGDFALKLISDALVRCFGEQSVIGRIGGDEFAVLMLPENGEDENVLRERMNGVMAQLNADSGKPYDVSVSMGFEAFACGSLVTMRTILEKADQKLLEDKKNKPKTIFKWS